jgi:hypothetical protein
VRDIKILFILTIAALSLIVSSPARAITCPEIWLMASKDVPSNALEICRREAAEGDVWAQEKVASAYAYGLLGAKKDDSEAFKWSRMAAGQGSTEVFSILSDAYENGKATPRSLIEAFKYKLLQLEHGLKRYPNESSNFGKDPNNQPVGRALLIFGVINKKLKSLLEIMSEDAVVEAFTRADRWDEEHGFKKFRCFGGDTACVPQKLE